MMIDVGFSLFSERLALYRLPTPATHHKWTIILHSQKRGRDL